MSFFSTFSTIICSLVVLLYALRLILQLYNRARISFLEKHIEMPVIHESDEAQEQLVSVLVSISHSDFIVPVLHALRKQSYKNLELLVAISHENVEISRSLKEEFLTLHREYAPNMQIVIFSGGKRASQNVRVLAGAAKGEYLCLLDERTRLASDGIAAALKVLQTHKFRLLSVFPHILGSSKLLLSYGAMLFIALGTRKAFSYSLQGTMDVFSCMRTGDYYKYFLHNKGHRKYTRNGEFSAEEMAYTHLSRTLTLSHAHVFSVSTTYHFFSPHEYVQWFIAAFRPSQQQSYDGRLAHSSKNGSRFLKIFQSGSGTFGAWLYLALFITAQMLIIGGMFVDLRNYGVSYVLVCLLGFITHYAYARSYGFNVYTAALHWFLSPVPVLHAFLSISGKAVFRIAQRLKHAMQARSAS